MAQVYLPSIFANMNKKILPDYLHKYLKIGGMNVPYNTDAWDGYPKERERLFKELKNANSILVLTGDTHNSWLNNLYDENNNFIGVEIGTPAISSPNTIDTFGPLTDDIEKAFIKENKNIKWTDGKHKGYTLLKLTKDKCEVSFVYVNTVKSKIYDVIDSNKFIVNPSTPII
jgi:alkaline phosphatase D